MPKLQERCVEVAQFAFGLPIESNASPGWLLMPGRAECGDLWPLVSRIYGDLADGLVLPETMPARERRTLDAWIRDSTGRSRIVEIDEAQHFNRFRATTLELYPPAAALGFPAGEWTRASRMKSRLEGGGFARPRPPLFPMENGRHRQRAFRDALADLLPSLHGWGPTIRIAHFEIEPWIWTSDAEVRFRAAFASRFSALQEDSMPAKNEERSAIPVFADSGHVGSGRTQPVTAADLANGRIRIPDATKPMFPHDRGPLSIVLRGTPMSVRYDPRDGPDKSRSGVLGVGKSQLGSLVGEGEVLEVRREGKLLHLD